MARSLPPTASLDVRRAFEAGRRQYGDLGLDLVSFARRFEDLQRVRLARLGLEATPDAVATSLHAACGDDVYLTLACDDDAPGAWEILQRTFEARLVRVGQRRGLDARTAERRAADVFARLAEPPARGAARTVAGTFSGAGKLGGWLVAILVRAIAADARRKRPALLGEHDDAARQAGGGAVGASAATDPARALLDQETAERFAAALRAGWAACTERERLVLLYRFRDGLRQNVMARLLGVGAPRVSRLVRSALARLTQTARGAALDPAVGPGDEAWSGLSAVIADSLATLGAGTPSPDGDTT